MIPEEAILQLKADPSKSADFDEVFGKGAAASALGEQPAQEEGVSLGGRVVDLGRGAVRGVVNAVHETGQFISDAVPGLDTAATWLNENVADTRYKAEDVNLAPTKTVLGGFAEGTSQFISGFIGAGKFKFLQGATSTSGKIVQAMGKGAIADAVVMDPHQDRLSNLIGEYTPSLSSPLTDYLASDPNDSNAEGRFKNVVEGSFLGLAGDALLAGARLIKASRSGKPVTEALVKEAEQADALLRGEALPDHPLAPAKPAEAVTPDATVPAKAPEAPAPVPGESNPARAPVFITPEKAELLKTLIQTGNGREFGLHGSGIDMNFQYIRGEEDVRAMFNAVAVVIKDAKTGPRPHAETTKMAAHVADTLGLDVDKFSGHIGRVFDATHDLDVSVTAVRIMNETLVNRVNSMQSLVNNGMPGVFKTMDQAMAALLHHQRLLGDFVGMTSGLKTNIARALNSMKIVPSQSDALGKGLDKMGPLFDEATAKSMIQNAGGERAVRSLAAKLALAGRDPKANNALAKGTVWDKSVGIFNEVFINGILSSLKTSVVNSASNAANVAIFPGLRMLGGVRTLDGEMFKEGARQYWGELRSIKDSVMVAAKALREDRNILDASESFLDQTKHAITSQNIGVSNTLGAASINAVGAVIRLPTRFMMGQDEFFKQMVYRGRVYADARTTGIQQGMEGKQLAAFVKDVETHAFETAGGKGRPPVGSATDHDALLTARQATFSQPLSYGTNSRTLGEGVQSFVNHHPGLRIVAPFIKTPTNMIRYAWQHTPIINQLERGFRQDIAAGGDRAAMAKARTVLGGTLWAVAIDAALEGKITGGGPKDPEVRKRQMESGQWQPYSYVSENEDGTKRFIDFNRADPFGMFFGIAADMAEIGGQLKDNELSDVALSAAMALAKNLSSKTYLKGIFDSVDALHNPERYGEKWLQRTASSALPYSAMVRDLNHAFGDDTLREVRSVLDAFKAKIPSYSDTLDPKRDIFGQKMEVPMGWSPEWMSPVQPPRMLNPIRMLDSKEDVAGAEIARQALTTGTTFRNPPEKMGQVDLTDDAYRVSANQTAYDRMLELVGTVKGRGAYQGLTIKEAVEKTVQSAKYQRATDGTEHMDGSRVVMLQAVIGGYRAFAQAALRKELPALDVALKAQERAAAQQMRPKPNAGAPSLLEQ